MKRFAMLAAVGLAALSLTACARNRSVEAAGDVGRASEYLREHGYKSIEIAFVDYSASIYDLDKMFCGGTTDATREHDDAARTSGKVYAFHTVEGSGLLCIRNDGTVELLSPVSAPPNTSPDAEPAKR